MDPKTIGQRIVVGGLGPVNICVIARKVKEVEIFRSWPLQSDYQVEWGEEDKKASSELKGNASLSQKFWNILYQNIKNYCPVIIEPYKAFKKLKI